MKCNRSGKPRIRTKPTAAGAKRRKYKSDKNAPTELEKQHTEETTQSKQVVKLRWLLPGNSIQHSGW